MYSGFLFDFRWFCSSCNIIDVNQRTDQLAPVFWRKLGLSAGCTPMAFPTVLDQKAVEFQFEVVRDLLVQKLIGLITGHSRVWDPLVLFSDPIDVRVHRKFVPSEGEQQDA